MAIERQKALLHQNINIRSHFFTCLVGETAVFRETCILPGLRPHQHLRQAAAGELAGIFAHHIENGLL